MELSGQQQGLQLQSPPTGPYLDLALAHSHYTWFSALENLLDEAQHYFPDVLWEFIPTSDGKKWNAGKSTQRLITKDDVQLLASRQRSSGATGTKELWGHKAIIAIREPKLLNNGKINKETTRRAIWHVEGSGIDYKRYKSAQRFAYTARRDVHNFEDLAETSALALLRSDLLFMWKSEVHCDLTIELHLDERQDSRLVRRSSLTAIRIMCHAFMLASRSEVANSAIKKKYNPERSNSMLKIPADAGISQESLLLFLEYVYTGTVVMTGADETFEGLTALHRTAAYFQVDALMTEAKARILATLFHGGSLHSYSPSFDIRDEFFPRPAESVSTPCFCQHCCVLVVRILCFGLGDPLVHKDVIGLSRQGLLAIFGPGWCSPEFEALPKAAKYEAVQGIIDLISPETASNILLLAEMAASVSSFYEFVPMDLLMEVRHAADIVWGSQTDLCFGSLQFQQIIAQIRGLDDIQARPYGYLKQILTSIVRGIEVTHTSDRWDTAKLKTQIVREILGQLEALRYPATYQPDWNQKFILCLADAMNKFSTIAKQAPTTAPSRTRTDQRRLSVSPVCGADEYRVYAHADALVIKDDLDDPDEADFLLYNSASAALAARSISWHSNSSFTGSDTTDYGSLFRRRTITSLE